MSRYWSHCITASLVPSVEGGSGDETISLQVQSRIISSILFPELLFVMYFNLVLCSVVTTTYVLIYVLYV